MIRVLLADDHQMFLDGIKAFLANQADIEIIGEATNGEDVLKELEKNVVDIVVMDIEMPGLDGIEATKIIRSKYPQTKVLIVSMYDKKSFIMRLMDIGVNGYILKNKSENALLTALRNVYVGKPYFGLDILNVIQTQGLASSDELPPQKLSERELEVLCHIGEGYTTKEISGKLHIAEATVNTHRRNLLNKLEVPNDKFLVRYAIRHKLIEP